ncbi:hypothetical protein [Winogradskyella immobilis]|uniref:Uncharacterized protein n=1 Tax=Winogradskyella immobilis TaxID=2816852 RepID=A0ABS8EKD5_9FLAO|nr:hypothetical protein [Winogradskyella immobilis]MCC1483386.1 hypothetical protein [Winogradskyella immobilis]MCG0015480.1 hypothetical protein [Winogradskyella immobilis]
MKNPKQSKTASDFLFSVISKPAKTISKQLLQNKSHYHDELVKVSHFNANY